MRRIFEKSKKYLLIILLIATVFSTAAFSVTGDKPTVSAETIVTATSPGSYDDYTRSVNQKLGITGSTPATSHSGDNNFSFALKPTVSFSDIYIPADNYTFDRTYEFSINVNRDDFGLNAYADMNIYVNEIYAAELSDVDAEESFWFFFNGTYSAQEKRQFIYLHFSDFTKTGEWWVAPLSQWFNENFYESWYSDGVLEDAVLTSQYVPFWIDDELPPSYQVASQKTTLNYTLRLENSDLASNRGNSYFWFDLWRENVAAQSEQLITRYVVFSNGTGLGDGTRGDFVVAKKDFTYSNGTLELDPSQLNSPEPSHYSSWDEPYYNLIRNGYMIIQGGDYLIGDDEKARSGTNTYTLLPGYNTAYLKFNDINGQPTIDFSIEVTDVDAVYRCYFGYNIERLKSEYVRTFLFFYEWQYSLEPYRSGCIWSEPASVASVLEEYDEANTLEEHYIGDELTIANSILDKKSMRTVEIIMLEQIEGTPFAHKVSRNVTLPVRDGRIYYDSICQALGLSTLKVLNSNVESVVEMNSDGQFEIDYLAAVWLHAASVSGASVDTFLNINESYESFFNRQTGFNVERDQNGRIITGTADPHKQVLTIGMYQYFLNEIKNKYPVLESYNANEIYGYWGFFAIPQEYNLDAAWAEVFGNATQYKNVAHYFRHNVSLSYEAYDMLLEDYGHGYLERLFNSVVGGVFGYDATYFMVYVDDAGYSAVSDSGSTDPSNDKGVVGNEVGKFTSFFSKVFDGILDFANNYTWVFVSIIAIVVLAVVAVILWKNSKNNKGGRGRRK